MSEKIKIVQYFLPPMPAGKYSIEATQEVMQGGANIERIQTKLDFAVDAARFKLNSNDIYSVYPPANQSGLYSSTFPQVVFSRRTLPWERSIDGQSLEKGTVPAPWMALLLFTREEMKKLQIVQRTLGDIVQPHSEGIIRPGIHATNLESLALMPWEKTTDGCLTIDITKEQFEEYIPSWESLPFLAHAKEVILHHKDKEGISDTNEKGEGVFSVIMGNRLPTTNQEHTAVLVSLEGYQKYLKSLEKTNSDPENSSWKKARLIVLASWDFEESGNKNISELINGLEIKSLKVQRENEDSKLESFFEAGYVPMEHLTRTGAHTISWYRGPFTPKPYQKNSKCISFGSSDAALRYDETTGFFDVSFAAAWQLGRMLALQNQEFSKTMLNWYLENSLLIENNKKNEVYDEILKDVRVRSLSKIENGSETGEKEDLKKRIINYLADTKMQENSDLVPGKSPLTKTVPQSVKSFLGNLYELKGVPFSYLVPHEFLLEKEHPKNANENYSGTLSFFYIDPNWIEALLDGALSIGRVENNSTLLEEASRGNFKKEKKLPADMTGFLFRSDLISGWRGLEIKVFDKENSPLQAVRFERIDADILLGIFNGHIGRITITQPYEGLYFGIQKAKEILDSNEALLKNRVLNVAGLAEEWAKNDSKAFTSAEFAIQLINDPIHKTIEVNV